MKDDQNSDENVDNPFEDDIIEKDYANPFQDDDEHDKEKAQQLPNPSNPPSLINPFSSPYLSEIPSINSSPYLSEIPSINPSKVTNPNDNSQMPNAGDEKRIQKIMKACESLYNKSITQYENFNIREAMISLCKAIKGLDGLKDSIINKKTSFTSLLPNIISLRNKAFKNIQEYRINIYQIINLKFKAVPYDQSQPLSEFSKRYLLTEPFLSFDDIFDPSMDQNKKLKFVMNDYFKKSQRMGYKSLLLCGPNGCGKTLAVHALAHDLKAKVAQIEGNQLFQIPYFAMEFAKVIFNYMQFKPLIVYIKNMEEMFSNMNDFNFLYDRTSSSHLQNVIFIASSTVPVQMLPKEVSKKFHYIHSIRPVDKNHKIDYIKFLSQKIGIRLHISDEDLNTFSFKNLNNYSNGDIFNLIITAIEMKNKEIGDGEENKVYKEGLNINDLTNALNNAPGTLTPEVMKNYYL